VVFYKAEIVYIHIKSNTEILGMSAVCSLWLSCATGQGTQRKSLNGVHGKQLKVDAVVSKILGRVVCVEEN
jgi:hypothetical protein